MAFDWNSFEKEKSKQPLHKQTGTDFNPTEKEDNKEKNKSSNSRSKLTKVPTTNGKLSKSNKTPKTKIKKLSKQEQKENSYKEFKGKLGISLSDLVIDYFDKTIRSLEDLTTELRAKKEEAIEQLKIKD